MRSVPCRRIWPECCIVGCKAALLHNPLNFSRRVNFSIKRPGFDHPNSPSRPSKQDLECMPLEVALCGGGSRAPPLLPRGTTERDLLRAGAAMLIRLWPATGTPENRWADWDVFMSADCTASLCSQGWQRRPMQSTPSPAHGFQQVPELWAVQSIVVFQRSHDV